MDKAEAAAKRVVIDCTGKIPEVDLPEGWIALAHQSGGIVYIHTETRVVTWSRPYLIHRTASVRKHDPPLISIPCLHERRSKEGTTSNKTEGKEDEIIVEDEKMSSITNGGQQKRKQCPMRQEEGTGDEESSKKQKLENSFPSPCQKPADGDLQKNHDISVTDSIGSQDESLMETEDASTSLPSSQESNATSLGGGESQESSSSTRNNKMKNVLSEFETVHIDSVHDYLGQLFKFRDLEGDEWKLPLFTDKAFNASQTFLVPKKKERFETKGKTNLQVLYEYTQKESKTDSKVVFSKIEAKGLTEFYTETVIGNLKYGIGKGDTFKIAKHDASKVTIDILNPKLVPKEDDEPEIAEVYQFYDDILIDDEKVVENMSKYDTDEEEPLMMPYDIMLQLLERNHEDYKSDDLTECYVTMPDEYEYSIKYKEIEATAGSGHMEGSGNLLHYAKQLAAQIFIKEMFPLLKYWGSIIRLSRQRKPVAKSNETPSNKYLSAMKDAMRKMTNESS
ncbi:microprocessor complex subunit DGCR8-like [Clytia hemisphaerica]|uniref:WW domain-containing protein n=1 Tax=Clytia hemisphaerica TaxID=252671 RepID=A0A7M5WRG1_9CNID|eukprot:TCONS_00050872-protein